MYFAGIDLGQRQDHTAIAVVERVDRHFDGSFGLVVRHLERVPLGTSYPAVVERVREVIGHEELAGRCAIVVDATGVGAPVVEMLRGARLGCEIAPVVISGGDRESQHGSTWSVPKRDLITGLQLVLERRELKIARQLREAGPLVRELMDVRMTMAGNGRVRMGADGSGEHDDLVIALALACWRAKRRGIGFVEYRLPGI